MKAAALAVVLLALPAAPAHASLHHHVGADWGRPSAWCGWYMRQHFGGGPEYNLARNWAHRGHASWPHTGAVIVWYHHVGWISGPCRNGGCVITSGNDGHRVRTRFRSIAGAIAFRSL